MQKSSLVLQIDKKCVIMISGSVMSLKFFVIYRKDIKMDADGRKRKKGAGYYLLYPLILLQRGLTAMLEKLLGDSFKGVTEDDIMSMVDAGSESGEIENTSAEIISNVFEFDDICAADVMTHRVNIIGVEENGSLDDVVYLALEEGFSRIPVYRDDIDNIIGIVIVKDLLCLIGKENIKDCRISDFLREVSFIPEACSCADAFKQLTSGKSGLAVVLDEYGGTAGIVTVEDLIESILGSIEDEYDDESQQIKEIGKSKYEIVGECDPEEVLELFGYELPEEHEYETIAGFVTDILGYIPESAGKPQVVDYKDVRFVVLEVEDNCISRLIAYKTTEKVH